MSADKSTVTMATLYLSGVAEGIMAANAEAESSLRGSLFCQPRNLSLNTDNLAQMVGEYLKKLAGNATQDELDNFEVSTILLGALKDIFPCGAKK